MSLLKYIRLLCIHVASNRISFALLLRLWLEKQSA
jgi:hypothetical protein